MLSNFLESRSGFHILMLTGKMDKLEQPFEKVKDNVQTRLYRERRNQAYEKYVNDIKQKSGAKIFRQTLAKSLKLK